ncbi:hypothetical protein EJB05_16047 [Eragrostis curvula]|uniref:Serine aminopeptidase S33 domain-containing protein n=1 Tax=Eragrostis curvula TaxID=38414 RepID=A0A5J9VE04_9POAL|nr:hypothetical protein EJB05_16047 [Eragrostis curvula]
MAEPQASSQDAPNPAASEQRIVVANKHGENLVGVLHHTGSNKVVVLCHGFTGTKDDGVVIDLTSALTKQGISVFRFDFSGNGESEGEFQYGNYRKEADDLHSVVSYLREKYDVTAIVGHSKGGDVVVLYASIYNDVPMVVNLSGRFDLKKGVEERLGKDFIDRINKEGFIDVTTKSGKFWYRVTKESLMERLNTDMRAASLSISKECRFFTIHGSADETIPVEDAYEFAKLIPNHKLCVIEGADHCYTAHRKEVSDAVVDCITWNEVKQNCKSIFCKGYPALVQSIPLPPSLGSCAAAIHLATSPHYLKGLINISHTAALEQRVVVPNRHGENLVGVLHHTGSKKVVVLCHGFTSTKDDGLVIDLTAVLIKQGISVFRFDFSGNGESEGEFQYGNYRKEADDLHSIVSYLSQEKYDVTAIVGRSKGGNVVVLYASLYNDVPMAVNISGRFDLKKGVEERLGKEFMDRIKREGFIDATNKSGKFLYRVTKESLTERLNTDMRAASLSISRECRFFTIHGAADEVVPVEDAYEFAKFIPNHKLRVIEGANHCYTAHRKEISVAVIDCITSYEAGDTRP